MTCLWITPTGSPSAIRRRFLDPPASATSAPWLSGSSIGFTIPAALFGRDMDRVDFSTVAEIKDPLIAKPFTATLSSKSGRALAGDSVSECQQLSLRLTQQRQFASLSMQFENASSADFSDPSRLTSTVGSSPALQPFQLVLTPRHIQVLSFIACTAAISATWLFFSAIPTLLATKREASSLEKLMDAMREELPETMAAVRLSGMEISDLTMELSDLGQEITQGVRSSTRAVRLAEEKLQQLTNITRSATMQGVAPVQTKTAGPALARSARGMKDGIIKGRAILQMLLTLSRYSGMAFSFITSRAKMRG